MKKHCIYLTFFLLINTLIWSKQKNILIIHSYSPNNLWTKKIQDKLYSHFTEKDESYTLLTEYLDIHHLNGKQPAKRHSQYLKRKYRNLKIDLIIATDDSATKNALYKREFGQIFKDTPILGTGISHYKNFKTDFPDIDNTHLILEQPSFRENIELAMQQNPNAKKLFLISDHTLTGWGIREEIDEYIKEFNLRFEWSNKMTYEVLKKKVASQNKNTIILFYQFFKDKTGMAYNPNKTISELTNLSQVPIYVNWDYYFNSGAFGGKLYSSEELANYTCQIADRILSHEKLPEIIEYGQINDYYFDHRIIEKYSYENRFYPEQTNIVNKPENFFVKNRKLIILHLIVFSVGIVLLLLAYSNIKKQIIINQKDKKLLDEQNEIIYRIGNIIESRCNETKFHVERVGLISKHLAIKIGLPIEEANLIKQISPLHDVGKVGIPDNVLNSTEKLSNEEFEIMKEHTSIGYNILKGSGKRNIDLAAIVAHQHHERWDGNGYPQKLKGEEIHLFARITMVADVLDALLSKRSYKKEWTFEEVIKFLQDESGKMFDPKIVEVTVEHQNEIHYLRNSIV